MENVRDALLRMYKSAKDLKVLSDGLRKLGIGDEPIYDAFGNVADAIYYTIGETRPYDQSVTHLLLEHMMPEEKVAVDMLMNEYEKNYKLPAPQLMSREEMAGLYAKNGGYMRTTPEGEWT